MNARLLLPVAVIVGGLLPVQFALNSALTGYSRSPTATAAWSYGSGAAALLLGLLLAQQSRPGMGRLALTRLGLTRLAGAPAWSYLGGVVGSAYVVGSVVLTRQLGAALAVSLVIAAQVVTGLLLDHLGALGLPRRPLNRVRVTVLLLVLGALALQVRQ